MIDKNKIYFGLFLFINIFIAILFIYAMFGYRKIEQYELLLLLVTITSTRHYSNS